MDCGGTAGIATDNLHRGVSLSGERPAWFVAGHCEPAPGWVAGLAVSRVHLVGRRGNLQLTLYLDRRWQLADDWSAKLGIVHYDASERGGADGLRYDELNAAIGFRGRWRASIALSPNTTDVYYRGAMPPMPGLATRRYRTLWVESTLHQPLADGQWALDAGIGAAFPAGQGNSHYSYASLGLRWSAGDVYLYGARLWTESVRWRFDFFGQSYEAALPARNGWMGTAVWSF